MIFTFNKIPARAIGHLSTKTMLRTVGCLAEENGIPEIYATVVPALVKEAYDAKGFNLVWNNVV